MAGLLIKVKVDDVREEAEHIRSFRLSHAKGKLLPAFSAGAHIDVLLGNGLKRQYSLASDPSNNTAYRIAVLHEQNGRGGSAWLHEHVQSGSSLVISSPRNTFALSEEASHHIFIAGGIGITPFLAMIPALRDKGQTCELHYCARSKETAAFVKELEAYSDQNMIKSYFDGGDPSKGCNISAVLANRAVSTHLYCCGPKGLTSAVKNLAAGWSEGTVHFEHFIGSVLDASAPHEAFTLELQRSGIIIGVSTEQSALQSLTAAGIDIDVGCESGACGSCITGYSEGTPIHHDVCLSPKERLTHFTPCVSRATGALKIDL
jgi:vanillate monooxygenase ferredoxin subunit